MIVSIIYRNVSSIIGYQMNKEKEKENRQNKQKQYHTKRN